MTPMIDDDTIENASIDGANEYGVEATTKEPMQSDHIDSAPVRGRIPWIGAFDNPRLGPMVVVGDGGYLVPLWTASDLLRGCRYLWRASQE